MAQVAAQPLELVTYTPEVEEAISRVQECIQGSYRVSRRALAVLLLQGDREVEARVQQEEPDQGKGVLEVSRAARAASDDTLDTVITLRRRDIAAGIASEVMTLPEKHRVSFGDRLSRMCVSPITGPPILLAVLWLGLYQFVGVFGGGTLVEWFEGHLFDKHINPWVTAWIHHLIPYPWLSSLFVGDYGIWTLGVTYAVALILPIVGTFFIAFSVLEDSGYFPRLAMLVDRMFKGLGLNGKAVIPIVLGFGCDTMATLVTRILETRRERLMATFLLALAIPCSAQMGVMTALLHDHPLAFIMWAGIMAAIFVLVGWITARLLPGEPARFAMELPPLRWPSPINIVTKTLARMKWYFLEVFPLFVAASVVIWVGQLIGLFQLAVRALVPIARVLGLPDRTAQAFLFGFFRRDYGAAGLYQLQNAHLLTGNQLLVAVVTLTIFLPCIAQFLIMKKERGLKASLSIAAFILPFAIGVGVSLKWALVALNIKL